MLELLYSFFPFFYVVVIPLALIFHKGYRKKWLLVLPVVVVVNLIIQMSLPPEVRQKMIAEHEMRKMETVKNNAFREKLEELEKGDKESELFKVMAQDYVRGQMKDSSSVKFRNVRVVNSELGRSIVGEVNAKNSFGAYSGFQAFTSNGHSLEMQE